MSEGGAYRTSAAPRALESTCLLCGSDGEADQACATCAVPMPRITCACGVVNAVTATRCRQCSAPLGLDEKRPRGCPRCLTWLTDIAVHPSANVHACAACRGLFVPARAWHQLSAREELVLSLEKALPIAAAPPSVPPDTRLFACPDCASEMERMRFAATSQIVIDACTAQHGIWLDAGAVASALAYAKHRRAIGAEAARREAEAIERAQPGGDPIRRQHEIALAMARERQERAAQGRFEAPEAPTGKRHYTLFAVLGLMALFYISLSTKDCSRHGRPRESDAPDTNVKTLQRP